MRYALAQQRGQPLDEKHPEHAECGEELVKLLDGSGRYACSKCLRVGYPTLEDGA